MTTKYVVWIKERGRGLWTDNGDGPMTLKQAERVSKELRTDFRIPVKILPEEIVPEEAMD